jgi:hypothetical protein
MLTTDDDDPIVAEVRRHREEYAASFGYDIKLMANDMNRRGQALTEAMARLGDDPKAIINLLSSKRWNGGLGPLGASDD